MMYSTRVWFLFLLAVSWLALTSHANTVGRQEDGAEPAENTPGEDQNAGRAPQSSVTNGSEPQPEENAPEQPPASEGDGVTGNSTESKTPEKSPVLSSLYINTAKPGLGSRITTKVFKDGALSGLFNSCLTTTADPSTPDTDCFLDDQYNDRLQFDIIYSVPASEIENAFKATPPTLQLLGDSADVSDAIVLSYAVALQSSSAEVMVRYFCKKDADALIDLELKIQFGADPDSVVPIKWKKKCTGGVNTQLEFGYTTDNQKSGEKVRHPFGSDADAPYVVPPSDVSTEVYAKLLQPGAQQEFLAPLVISSDPSIVSVAVRGNHPNGGIFQGLDMTEFQVSYECVTKGSSDVSVSVGIPPFQNLTSTWEKDCGGKIASKLSVGSTEGAFDIVDMGKPTPKYMVAIENIGTAHSEEHLHLPGNQSEWTIYLTYGTPGTDSGASKDAALHIGRIGVTVEHPGVIAAASPRLSTRRKFGWGDVTNSENSLNAGEKVKVSFHFVCRKVGESRLLITVPILDYDTLEFGIAKECDHVGSSHKAKQFVLTVGNVSWVTGVVVVLAVAYCVRKRRRDAGFQPVANTEK